MKLLIASDFHLEMYALNEPFVVPDDVDVFVMAGDLANKTPANGIRWLQQNVNVPSIYVAGNHEFYRGSIVEGLQEGREAAKEAPLVHFLENDTVIIGGVRFIGATLWTDFRLMGNPEFAMFHAKNSMNDYRTISFRKNPYKRLTPEDTLRMNLISKDYIDRELAEPFNGKTVVVTHHAPHPLSVHKKYGNDLLNAAFASNLDHLIQNRQPDLWVHGHTHTSFNYSVGSTNVICNPRGYGTENNDFDIGLVYELGT